MKLFDAHCHLQDPRIFNLAQELISSTRSTGVTHFAVNGTSEKDWPLVKQMSESHPSILPCLGIHPWDIQQRTPNWLTTLKQYFDSTPSASIGEIGLDKGSRGKQIDFNDQIDVFTQQLELAKELKKPASVHCVRAYGDLLNIMKSIGSFLEGVILHSYLGSAEMVPEFARLGGYFSFSGFLMSMKSSKVKKMVKVVPKDRILLETDAPDALPNVSWDSLYIVKDDPSIKTGPAEDGGVLPKGMLNHPVNIWSVLSYVASFAGMTEEEVADLSYANAMRLFSFAGSKVHTEG